jgi:hypothetical protein
MAFQLSGPQLIEWAQKAIDVACGKEEKYKTFGEMLDAEVQDPKDRAKMFTALAVLSDLAKESLTAHDVIQVIRWRDENGQPGSAEIAFNKYGRQKRAIRMQEQQRLQSIRDTIQFNPWALFR